MNVMKGLGNLHQHANRKGIPMKKKLASFIFLAFSLLLTVFVAQTASACLPDSRNATISIVVGDTITISCDDVVTHEALPPCTNLGQSGKFSFMPPTVDSADPTIAATTVSGIYPGITVTVTGVQVGTTTITFHIICDDMGLLLPFTAVFNVTPPPPPPPPPPPSGNTGNTTFSAESQRESATLNVNDYEAATIKAKGKGAPVYDTAGKDRKQIGTLENGAKIGLIQWVKNESWCRVFYNNGNNAGWVEAKCIVPAGK